MENNKSSEKLPINKNLSRKSSLIINEDEKILYFNQDNSYIEYFFEIGIRPSLFMQDVSLKINSIDSLNKKLSPDIISKFPNFDKNSIIIDPTIIKTIFPKGFKSIEAKIKPDPVFYSIILDNQQSSSEYIHKYISCLIIYENFSKYISLYKKYTNKDIDKNISEKFNAYYIPKCIAIASLNNYIDKHEEILRSLYEIFLSKKINNLLLEEIIMKLVIEIPKIPKGLRRIILKLPNKSIELTENKMNELPYIHVDLSHAIGHFNLEDLIDIFSYLLIETKMIFFSSKISELTNTILSFLEFLSPLKYQYQIVSVLPRELFSFCKTISPFLFGINESYYPHYFRKNKIDIEDSTICIVDIDAGKYLMIAPGKELDEKEYPEMPINLREKISNKMSIYYQKLKSDSSKKNNIKEDNKKYQKIFYNFMLYLFKDYPKFLKLDYGVRKTIKMHIKYLIDLESYIKSKDSNERDFYKKVLNTQMFIEYIYKRMMPKDCGEKIEALFFEEKIYEQKAKKNFFGKSNITERNILLSTKQYDIDKKVGEIIDLSNLSINSKEIIKYLNEYKNKNPTLFNKDCIFKGFYIDKNKDNTLKFNYLLFPMLFNERIYKINKNNFHPGKFLFKSIEKINSKIVNKIHLQLQNKKHIKNSEIENDNYLSYLIIWSLTFWYTDREEREFRFYQMIEVLDKIEEHEIEIFEILFESVVKSGTEDNIRFLYQKFIEKKLNPSWKIFNLVSKYLKSSHKLNMMSKSQTNIFNSVKEEQILAKSRSNKSLKNAKEEKIKSFNPSFYRMRTLKNLDIDENIFSDDVEFMAFCECKYCKNIINLAKLCSNLNATKFKTDQQTGVDKIKCPNKTKDNKYCDRHSEQILSFQFGVELFNQDLENESTCSILYVPLLSPTTIKKKLLFIANTSKNTNFNVELFKKDYSKIFWNCLWYFELNDMEISFMLPYADTTKSININPIYNIKFNTNMKKNENKTNPNETKSTKEEKTEILNFEINKPIPNEYNQYDLCKQTIFQFSIIENVGYMNHLSFYSYQENIGYNELPLFNEFKERKKNNKEIKKGLRASFWFSAVNRIIEKSLENKMKVKYRTEADINSLINDIDKNDDNMNKTTNEIDLNRVNYEDEYNQRFNNYSYKRRGTLTNGVFDEENNLQNDSFDYEDEIL